MASKNYIQIAWPPKDHNLGTRVESGQLLCPKTSEVSTGYYSRYITVNVPNVTEKYSDCHSVIITQRTLQGGPVPLYLEKRKKDRIIFLVTVLFGTEKARPKNKQSNQCLFLSAVL